MIGKKYYITITSLIIQRQHKDCLRIILSARDKYEAVEETLDYIARTYKHWIIFDESEIFVSEKSTNGKECLSILYGKYKKIFLDQEI